MRTLLNLIRLWESRNLNVFTYRCMQVNLVSIPYDSKCVTVSVSIAVSVHASVSALVSVSVLVTVYCYFRHPGALPPPSPQLLQLPFCSVIPGTGSLNNPLSPGAEKCHPEKAAQPSGGCTGCARSPIAGQRSTAATAAAARTATTAAAAITAARIAALVAVTHGVSDPTRST